MEWGFRAEPKTGSFPAEGWLFIIGTLALSERNGGSFRADYAAGVVARIVRYAYVG